uniref:Polyprotein n=1 Tax=Cajanus cajan TaxID=3821 RepID=A0A151R5E0_CAJCA|nr:polyprotein [Cajanus cajan]
MNEQLLQYFQQEIKDLLNKNLIRPSKSPWSCAAFYVNKQAEIERGTPRLVINYKPLNQALQWIRYPIPNKKDLLNRLHSAKIFSKFDMKSGYWQIQIQEKESRLKKNPPSWNNDHTTSVKHVKQLVKNLPCLSLPIPQAFKIVETDASDLGRGKQATSPRKEQPMEPSSPVLKLLELLTQQNQVVESSTQHTNQPVLKLLESLTQPNQIAESSTQQTSQPQKQTKLDYAIPISISTLMGLRNQSLTSIPNKTWADIMLEEEDEKESIALDLLIGKTPEKQIQSTSQSQIAIQTKSQKAQSHYIPKNKFWVITQMESEFWDKNPNKISQKIFPEGFHFKPLALNKTRKFYEFILVDTDSVAIKHYKDPKDPSNVTHTTFQILKVLTPSQFGQNPSTTQKFSMLFDPIGYNYWDYIDAWSKTFWYQNKTNRHSWLIYFKRNFQYKFPSWFLQWWDFFGPIEEILPSPADEGFKIFKSMYDNQSTWIPADLQFFSSFSLSWIHSWQYKFGKAQHPLQPPPLQRNSYVKWWNLFDASKANPQEVKNWFVSNTKYLKVADP